MELFLSFWYIHAPERFFNACRNVISSFDSVIATRTTLINLGKPLFQDYTWQGRVIGFGLRLLRGLGGYALYGCIWIVFAVAFLVWAFSPLIALMNIVGFFISSKL